MSNVFYTLPEFLLQIRGLRRINIGKISSLPINISRERIAFEKDEKPEKFEVGPTQFKPGPIFDKHEMTAVKFVSRLKLSKLIKSIEAKSIKI